MSAKGRATDMKELNIEPGMGPVDFRDEAGRHGARPRAGRAGQPGSQGSHLLPAVARQISYFEFDHVSQYADENGVWVWNEAPARRIQGGYLPPWRDAIAGTNR